MSCDQEQTTGQDTVDRWVAMTHPRLEDLPGYLEMAQVVTRTRTAAGDQGLAWLEAYVLGTARATDAPMDPALAAEITEAADAAVAAAHRVAPPSYSWPTAGDSPLPY